MDKTNSTIKMKNNKWPSEKLKIKNISLDNFNYWNTDYNLEEKLYKENKYFGNFDFNLFKITSKFLFYKIDENYEEKIFYNKIIINKKELIKGSIVWVHGWFNSKKLLNLALNMALNGFVVHLFDLRGFGNSTGNSYNETFESFYQDLALIIKECDNELPLFLLGHSLGSIIVTNFILINPQLNISGIICLSSLFTPPINRKYIFIKTLIIRYLGYFFDDFLMNSNLDWTSLCKNNYFLKKLIHDKNISYHIGLRFIRSYWSHIRYLKKNINKLKVPILFIQGKKDPLLDLDNFRSIIRKIDKKLVTIKVFKNCFHEIYLEEENFKINCFMLKWMNLILKYKKYNKNWNKNFLKTKRNKIKRKISLVFIISLYIIFALYLFKSKIYNNKLLLLLNPLKFIFNLIRITNKVMLKNVKSIFKTFSNEINYNIN